LLFVERLDKEPGTALAAFSDGERERGVDTWLAVFEPCVAAIEGDEGGSGERVK
jgi:hypothetical protein